MKDNKLAIAYIYTDSWKVLADIVLPVAQRYCAEHGYHLAHQRYKEMTPNFGFNKFELIDKIFASSDVDYVWMLDMDSLITNPHTQVHEIIKQHAPNGFFIISEDIHGLNAGSFIAKRSAEWSQMRRYCDSLKLVYDCEQDAIASYDRKKEMPKITVVEQRLINAYMQAMYPSEDIKTDWDATCLLLHTPGVGMMQRIKLFEDLTKVYGLSNSNNSK